MESVADRLDGIVWDGETLDQNIADSEFANGAKDAPVFVLTEPEATHGLRGLRIAVNWNGKLPAKHLQLASVIAMLVSKKQSIELLAGNATLLKLHYDLARAQSAIDQNVAMTGVHGTA